MSKRMAVPLTSYNGIEPSCSKEEAEAEFGSTMPQSAWDDIVSAFDQYAANLGHLQSTRLSKNPNDKLSWISRMKDSQKRIERALSALSGIDNRFFREISYLYQPDNDGNREFDDWSQRLASAEGDILFLSRMLHQAEPIVTEAPTEAESRKRLARDIFDILKPFGASPSNGWALENLPEQPSNADLTGFERLIDFLGIAPSETPLALAKWLREAVARD